MSGLLDLSMGRRTNKNKKKEEHHQSPCLAMRHVCTVEIVSAFLWGGIHDTNSDMLNSTSLFSPKIELSSFQRLLEGLTLYTGLIVFQLLPRNCKLQLCNIDTSNSAI